MSLGIYLHIPYCFQKCRYCDFYSLGHSHSVPPAYVDSLLREIKKAQTSAAWEAPVTVYFGGGTPSLLTSVQVGRLLQALAPAPGAEITLEANPGTVDAETLAAFYDAGINRLSIGVQTAHADSLAGLGRLHTVEDSRRIFKEAHTAGFKNISGDVMLALPHYTLQELNDTLDLLCEGGVTHISSYLLKIEPGTPFGKNPPSGLPTEDESADFYLACVEECTRRGYAQYEISNFAKPGFESRHNLRYWNCENYWGFGPAAHSCIEGKRFYYPSSTDSFIQNGNIVEEGLCTAEDYLVLQLRLAAGLNLTQLKQRFGIVFTAPQQNFLQHCVSHGLATLHKDVLRLTPQGLLVQNSILCELI